MSKPLEAAWQRAAELTETRVTRGTAPSSLLSIGSMREQSDQPGASVQTSAGFGDAGDGDSPDGNTVFRIASCTKSFTAVRALQLRDAGLLDLDRPVTELLPTPLVLHNPHADSPIPTPRMFLTMSGGLPTDDAWADRLESMSSEEFDGMLSRGIRLSSVPGTRYEYANLGWAILGRIMERIDGRPLPTQIENDVLDPLGLTGVRFTTPSGRRVARGFARRSTGWEPQEVTSPGAFSAIGGLFASGSDLLQWSAWLASAFSFRPGSHDSVLSAASRREMQQLHRAKPSNEAGVCSGYGYGLVVEHSAQDGHVIAHSGGYPGFSAHMRWSLDQGISVCGFENAGYAGVHHAVRDLLSGLLEDPPQQAGSPWPETQLAVERAQQLLDRPLDDGLWKQTEAEMFDSCVALDLPLQDRSEQITTLRRRAGTVFVRTSPVFPTPASARWELRGNRHTLLVTLQMTPLNPPRVQRFDVSLSEADNST